MSINSQKETLWALCFGDDISVAREFFTISDIVTLTTTENGELVAMASLVPVSTDNGLLGLYVYGVCTHPDHRGRGHFRTLMERCESIALAEKKDFLCLIPANYTVALTYRRMGYTIDVSLCKDKKDTDTKISSMSKEFSEYAIPNEECLSFDHGLLKPLSEKMTNGQSFSFLKHMGEC